MPAVTTLVGHRIYTLKIDQAADMPAVRMQVIGRVSPMHLRGNVNVYRSRVQIDAVEYEDHDDPLVTAHDLADAIRGTCGDDGSGPTGLVGFKGTIGDVEVLAILSDDTRERYESEVRLVKVEQDFIVWFKRRD